MVDPIDRNELLEYVWRCRLDSRERIDELVRSMPTLPARKRGQWKMLQIPTTPPVYKCSVCGRHALQTLTGCLINRHYELNLTNFCPNCGADMREGEKK